MEYFEKLMRGYQKETKKGCFLLAEKEPFEYLEPHFFGYQCAVGII